MASGPSRSGIITAPIVPPLNDSAIPRARMLAGNDSTAVLSPPGNVAPSPSPRTARASANPANSPSRRATCWPASRRRPRAACLCAGPRGRAPIPRPDCPACRSRKKNDVALVKSAAVRPVSLHDRRREDVEHLAIDERQPRAERHPDTRNPHLPGGCGADCAGVGWSRGLCHRVSVMRRVPRRCGWGA